MNAATIHSRTGYSRPTIVTHLTSTFNLSPHFRLTCLGKYFTRKWTGSYVRSLISTGTIRYEGTLYGVCYKDITPAELYNHGEVFLSFRAPIKGLEMNAYVIIAPVNQKSA